VGLSMKYIYLLLLLIFIPNIYAATCEADYQYDIKVTLPFKNQPANDGKYNDGLCFDYTLKTQPAKKVICQLSNFNTGWMLYSTNNLMQDSYSDTVGFTGNSTVIITSRGNTMRVSDNSYQFHVDETSIIAFHHDADFSSSEKVATVSCAYFENEPSIGAKSR
jgi:hypothetical protein